MDALRIERAAFVGWSDGACIALVLGAQAPARVAGVFFFACNMDPSGTKEIEPSPMLSRCFGRHVKDYARLSATPDQFSAFADAVGLMQRTEPNYSARRSRAHRACRSRSCRASTTNSSSANTPSTWRAAFRTRSS